MSTAEEGDSKRPAAEVGNAAPVAQERNKDISDREFYRAEYRYTMFFVLRATLGFKIGFLVAWRLVFFIAILARIITGSVDINMTSEFIPLLCLIEHVVSAVLYYLYTKWDADVLLYNMIGLLRKSSYGDWVALLFAFAGASKSVPITGVLLLIFALPNLPYTSLHLYVVLLYSLAGLVAFFAGIFTLSVENMRKVMLLITNYSHAYVYFPLLYLIEAGIYDIGMKEHSRWDSFVVLPSDKHVFVGKIMSVPGELRHSWHDAIDELHKPKENAETHSASPAEPANADNGDGIDCDDNSNQSKIDNSLQLEVLGFLQQTCEAMASPSASQGPTACAISPNQVVIPINPALLAEADSSSPKPSANPVESSPLSASLMLALQPSSPSLPAEVLPQTADVSQQPLSLQRSAARSPQTTDVNRPVEGAPAGLPDVHGAQTVDVNQPVEGASTGPPDVHDAETWIKLSQMFQPE